jgi:hypothetical protein
LRGLLQSRFGAMLSTFRMDNVLLGHTFKI